VPKIILCWFVFFLTLPYSSEVRCQATVEKFDSQNLKTPITFSLIDSLNKEAFATFRTDPSKAKVLALSALNYSEYLKYAPGKGKALNYIGITYHIAGEYDSAASYYKHSLEVFQSLKDTQFIGKVYNNLAYLYSDQEYQNLALEYSLKSIEIAEALKDTVTILDSYNNIGILYENMERNDKALEFFNKMLDLIKSNTSLKRIYHSALANIGYLSTLSGNYKLAHADLQKVLAYALSTNDNFSIEQTYNFLGLLYLKTNQPDSAFLAFNQSDHYAAKLDDKKTIALNSEQVGKIFYQQKQFSQAQNQFEKTIKLARENSFLKIEMEVCFYLASIDSVNQDFKMALGRYQNGVKLRDSLNSISNKKQIAELNIKHESIKKDQEISLLKNNTEIQVLTMKKQLLQRNLLFLILIIIVGFVAYVLYSNKKIAAKNNILLQNEEYLEKEVTIRTAELLTAKDKAEESDRLKSAFLANMSHEIRTPLNGILGFLELLDEKDLTQEDQENYFEIIRKSSDRLVYTINNIIDFSKIESGQMKLNLSEFDFFERTQFLLDFFTPEAVNKGLELIFNSDQASVPAIIYSDKDKLDAIMTNLIKNAIKYTNHGWIEFGYHLENGNLSAYVRDSGLGIPQDKIDSIFDRFIQIHGRLNQSLEGSGLGLAITKAYIDMLGGIIKVESEVNKGSVFSISIPVRILH